MDTLKLADVIDFANEPIVKLVTLDTKRSKKITVKLTTGEMPYYVVLKEDAVLYQGIFADIATNCYNTEAVA
jgi:hypothetical protein